MVKNGLVIAAPAAAGALGHPHVLGRVALAFAAFCLIASSTYLLNDLRDLEQDRLHPDKRRRPIASGALSPRVAVTAAVAGTAAGLITALLVSPAFLAVLTGYVALTLAYSWRLKFIPVAELGAIAGCFVLRAVSGGAAAGVSISGWFLAVVSFAALFVVTGKRYAEHRRLGSERARARATLGAYSAAFLRGLWLAASTVTIVAYCLWAVAHPEWHLGIPWAGLSTIPFGLGVARYAMLLASGDGDCPEAVFFADPVLRLLGLAWISIFAMGTYLGA